jgi:protocatechuate 3,4-dioxygenase, beta subunit
MSLEAALKAHPPSHSPAYKSTVLRSPRKELIIIPQSLNDISGPVYGHEIIKPHDSDLTLGFKGEPIGERILVKGKVTDDQGRAVPNTLIEIWQANAAGRYVHEREIHPAPLDPNFLGAGRTMTDNEGNYTFTTIKPGAYPWGNHHNAWRPAHIHFSLFGASFMSRLVTQMYFPGDPLFKYDPIFQTVTDEKARERLVSQFDIDLTAPEWALGYRFDICLRGANATPMEENDHDH